MKQITLNIPEKQYSFFIKLVHSLNFVQIADSTEIAGMQQSEQKLTTAQKETWNNIKTGFEELKLVEQGIAKTRPVQELLAEIGG
jgi:hypothetical protein